MHVQWSYAPLCANEVDTFITSVKSDYAPLYIVVNTAQNRGEKSALSFAYL